MSAQVTRYKAGVRKDKSGVYVDVLADHVGEVMKLVSGSTSTPLSPTHCRVTLPQGINVSDAKAILRRFDELSRVPPPNRPR